MKGLVVTEGYAAADEELRRIGRATEAPSSLGRNMGRSVGAS